MVQGAILPFAADVQEGLHRANVTRCRYEEDLMGFMDKAKKLAEQAQEKLDEAQKQFNSGGSTAGQPQGGGVTFDQHGRPVEAPTAQADSAPAQSETGDQPTPPSGDSNANPDPFKPIQ
jgi:transcription initiation factor TFIID subunit TAF12